MKKIYLLLLICAITLAGCSEGGKETAEEMEPAVTEEETAEPEKAVDDRDWSALYDGYIDVESLPALDVDLEREYVLRRHIDSGIYNSHGFICSVSPKLKGVTLGCYQFVYSVFL